MPLAFNYVSLAIFVLILVATSLHARVQLHVLLMKICFALDLSLLIAVELLRGAVEQALGLAPTSVDTSVLVIHIPFAVLTLVFWVVQIVTGIKVLKGRRELLPRHFKSACIFLALRLGTLVTSFML